MNRLYDRHKIEYLNQLGASQKTGIPAMGVVVFQGDLPQEGGFAVLFRGIFPDAQLFVALLIWRFSTYYLSILAGAALTVAENLGALGKKHTKAKREGVSSEQGH